MSSFRWARLWILASLLWASSAAAFAMDGQELLALCAANARDSAAADCVNVLQSIVEHDEVWKHDPRNACLPSVMDSGELRTTFVSYLGDYPDKQGLDAEVLVMMALRRVYPCIE